jgi:hypothetical protein
MIMSTESNSVSSCWKIEMRRNLQKTHSVPIRWSEVDKTDRETVWCGKSRSHQMSFLCDRWSQSKRYSDSWSNAVFATVNLRLSAVIRTGQPMHPVNFVVVTLDQQISCVVSQMRRWIWTRIFIKEHSLTVHSCKWNEIPIFMTHLSESINPHGLHLVCHFQNIR